MTQPIRSCKVVWRKREKKRSGVLKRRSECGKARLEAGRRYEVVRKHYRVRRLDKEDPRQEGKKQLYKGEVNQWHNQLHKIRTHVSIQERKLLRTRAEYSWPRFFATVFECLLAGGADGQQKAFRGIDDHSLVSHIQAALALLRERGLGQYSGEGLSIIAQTAVLLRKMMSCETQHAWAVWPEPGAQILRDDYCFSPLIETTDDQEDDVKVALAPLLSAGPHLDDENSKQETRIGECKGYFALYTKEQVLCKTEARKMEEERRTLAAAEAEENARSKERRAELLKQHAAAESAKDAARKAAEEKKATLLTVDRAGTTQ